MIKWKSNGEPVQAVMSHNFEGLTLTLNRFDNKTKQLEFVDKTGAKYYTVSSQVKFIYPDDVDPKELKRISDAMIIEKGDVYE